jgi:hypothetical protein
MGIYLSNLWNPQASLTGRTVGYTVTRGEDKGEYPLGDVNPAIVEKCRDPERGTTVFFCLGIRGDGSWAATEYLIRNWKHLAAEFDDRDFVVCLGFPKTEKHLEDYKEPIRLNIGDRPIITKDADLTLSHERQTPTGGD